MSDFDRLLGDSLKAIRDEHVRQIEPEVFGARRRIDHKLRGRRVRFVVGGTAVAAAALAAFIFVSQTVPKLDRATPIRPSNQPVIVNRIDVPGVGDIEPGLGALWVAHPKGLVGIDPLSGRVTTESPVRPVDHMSLNGQAMYAIDSSEREINRIPFGSNEGVTADISIEATPTRVAASDDAVWVAADTGPDGFSQILKLSPDDLAVQESIDLQDDLGINYEPGTVADMIYAGDALWMSAAGDRGFEVRRFSDDGAESGWRLSADEGPVADIVVGEGSAWVLRQRSETGGNTITRIDLEMPEANERLVTIEPVDERAVSFDDTIESIAVGEGYLWVTTAPTGGDAAEDARASLYRVDPATLETVGDPLEVGGARSQVEVGSGFVWVGDPNNNQIIQIDPSGAASPQPERSETPDDQDRPPGEACRSSVPFEPRWESGSWTPGVGSGGQIGVPLDRQNPPALIHYSTGTEGRYVDVTVGEPLFSTDGFAPVEVLGQEGALTAIEDGYAITFESGGCTYQLLAYGLTDTETRLFAEGLVPRGEAELTHDGFALWPETAPEEAAASCSIAARQRGSSRKHPQSLAVVFADEVLGWQDVMIGLLEDEAPRDTYRSVTIEPESSTRTVPRYAPLINVTLREVAPDCWSVSSLRTDNYRVPDDAPTGVSVSSVDGLVEVGFDLDREAAGHPVANVRLIVGSEETIVPAARFEEKSTISLRQERTGRPGAYLVLLEGRDGAVVGALGGALPSDDFVAG